MGIKHLNKYLQMNCKKSLQHIHLKQLKGKRIAIDISIYLYKYERENVLLENIYLMLSVFKKYDIIPIFIFDGDCPTEKMELIKQRQEKRWKMQKEVNFLNNTLSNNTEISKEEYSLISEKINCLKKKIIYITKNKIEIVKDLIKAYGETYITALGEADVLCAQLVLQNKVWACLSEDMDLFVYGCNRVIRYLSLLQHTAVLYNTKDILEELNMNQLEFREICILSGTDYNNNEIDIFEIFHYFHQYKKERIVQSPIGEISFYKWLQTSNYFNINYDALKKINNIFKIEHRTDDLTNIYDNGKDYNICMQSLKSILKDEGFIFI